MNTAMPAQMQAKARRCTYPSSAPQRDPQQIVGERGHLRHADRRQGAYTYDPAKDRLSQVGARNYTYDDNGNGNVLSDGERTLRWTAQNMVRSLQRGGQAWSLLYDADGTRVVREEAAANSATYNVASTYELRFEGSILSQARVSVLGAKGRVVAEVFAERTELEENALWEHHKKFVHDDHLGSTHMVTDRKGVVEAQVMYGPWGSARNGDNWYLTLDEGALDALPAGFTGHQPELDAGLINMRGRMYDPEVGRFMSVDPVIENALEVGTWNAYSYVLNRPLSMVDPTGLAAVTDALETELAYQDLEIMMSEFLAAVGGIQGVGISVPLSVRVEDRVESEARQSSSGKQVQARKGVVYPSLSDDPQVPLVPTTGLITLPDGTTINVIVADVQSIHPKAPNGALASTQLLSFDVTPNETVWGITLNWEFVVDPNAASSWLKSTDAHPSLRDHERTHAFIFQTSFKKELDARSNQLANVTNRADAVAVSFDAFTAAATIAKIANSRFDSKTGHNNQNEGNRLSFWTNHARQEAFIERTRELRDGTPSQQRRFTRLQNRY